MESIQIMSGFREIKDEFRSTCRIIKSASELALWFTFSNGQLCVHDLEDHKVSMILAIVTGNSIEVRRSIRSRGKELILNAFYENKEQPVVDLNAKYQLTGFMPFRLMK